MSNYRGVSPRLVVASLAVLIFFSPITAEAASLSELLRQQDKLKQESQQKEKQLQQKREQASSLENAIDSLEGSLTDTQNRINNTQGQIDVTSAVISKLAEEISLGQAKAAKLNDKLRAAYIALYELSRTSSTEMLAQGDDVSLVVSHGMYVQSIQDQLQQDIRTNEQLLADLGSKKHQTEQQKAELDSLKSRLASDQSSLTRQRTQKERYLLATQQDQAKLQEDLKKLEKQQEVLSSEIYEARRKQASGELIGGGGSAYPWPSEPNPNAPDPWLFIKRQCTSYAAWYFQRFYGEVFYNTRPGSGSAWNWPALARDQGYRTSRSPVANSIVSWPIGTNMPYGHVAWVHSVNSDGTINISEYNWVTPRGYSERRNVSAVRYGTPTYIYP